MDLGPFDPHFHNGVQEIPLRTGKMSDATAVYHIYVRGRTRIIPVTYGFWPI